MFITSHCKKPITNKVVHLSLLSRYLTCSHHCINNLLALTMEHILHGPENPIPIPSISIGKRLYEVMLKLHPEETLYIEATTGERTTYKEFLSICCRLANSLQSCEYKLNDVIAVSCENSSLCFVPIVASLFLGMISAPLNPRYSESEFAYMLEICQPKVVFCSVKVLESFVFQREKFECIERIIVLEDEIVDGYENLTTFIGKYGDSDFSVDNFEPIDVDPVEQIAFIAYSSGTTGTPKGVMITHDNVAVRAAQLVNPTLNPVNHEVVCLTLPNFHLGGLMTNVPNTLKGNTLVIMRRFEEELLLRAIEKYKITHLPMVPTIAHILSNSKVLQKYDLSSVEEMQCGGASLDREVEESIIERFPNLKCLRPAYGMTESGLVIAITPTGQRRPGSSGKLIPDSSLYIRDLKGGNSLGPNRHGEICVRGRLVTKGYYRNPEATKNTYIDGWLHTGDLGYYDEDGFIFVIDRIKELIKYKSFQVPPAEIEDILMSHPKIKVACVVGKPDRLAGELPTAFVIKQPGSDVTEEEIAKFLAGKVSKPKHLHGGVYFVEDLPRTASGKVMRSAVKGRFFKQNV